MGAYKASPDGNFKTEYVSSNNRAIRPVSRLLAGGCLVENSHKLLPPLKRSF